MKTSLHHLITMKNPIRNLTCTIAGLAVLGLMLFVAPSARAAAGNATWSGATDALWSTAGNWSGSLIPGAGNTATFNGAGNSNVGITVGTISLANITFDTINAAAYTLGATPSAGTITFGNGTTTAVTMNSAVAANETINADIFLGTAIASTTTFQNDSTAGTLTLGGTIGGGTGGLAAAKSVIITGSGNTTMSGVLWNDGASSVDLTKNGTGALTLSGGNLYTGNTTISGGVVNIQNATALGSTAAGTTVASGAALQIQGGIVVGAEALTLNGTGIGGTGALRNISGVNTYGGLLTLGSATRINSDSGSLNLSNTGLITGSTFGLTVGGSGTTTIAGIIGTGTGTLTKDGTGTLILSAGNTYTGATTISAGTLQVGNGATAGGIASGSAINNNATLAFNSSVSQSNASVISGTGNVIQAGTGATAISGHNTYNWTTTIGAGTLALGVAESVGVYGPMGQGGSIVFSGGVLQQTGGTNLTDYSSRFSTAANQQYKIYMDGSNSLTWASPLTSSGGSLSVINGLLTLSSSASTYNGTTRITSAIALNAAEIAGVSGPLGHGGSIVFAGGGLIYSASNSFDYSGRFSTAAGQLYNVNPGGFMVTWASALTSPGGSLNKSGASSLYLTGANTYTGTTTVSQAELYLGNGGTTGSLSTSSTIFINSTSTFRIDRSNAVTQGVDFGTIGSGTGGLVIMGGGTTTLNGTNGQGSTTVGVGQLNIASAGAIGTGTFSIGDQTLPSKFDNTSGAPLILANGFTWTNYFTFLGTNDMTFNGAIGIGASRDATITAGTLTLAGAASGAGNWAKLGNGTLVLSGNNANSGTLSVNAGVLSIRNSNALGTTAGGTTVASGAALQIQDNINVGAEALSIRGTGISSTGALRNISGTNTYGGNVTLAAATRINSDSGSLTLSGSITGATFGLTVGGAGATSISGILGTTSGTLTKDGAGTLTLGGTNTYTGATTISAGTLIATNASSFGGATGGAVTVAGGAALNYAAAADAQLLLHSTLGITGGSTTTIGGSIGASATSAEINVTGAINGTAGSGTAKVNIYGISGVTPLTGTYTLLHSGVASTLSTALTATPALGLVYNNTNFTVGALAATTTDLTASITSATALTSAFWTGTATSGITKVWAASDGNAASNWSSTSGGAVQGLIPTAVDATIVGTTVAATSSTLGADMTLRSLTIADTAVGLSLTADGHTLAITNSAGITVNSSVPASTIGANVALGADQTWTNDSANTLTVSGGVSGAFALTKAGTGTTVFSGGNTYTGNTTVSAGVLNIQNATALGSTAAGTSVTNGAALQIQNNIMVGAEALTLNGTGIGGTGVLRSISGNNTWQGTVTLASDARINSDAGTLTFNTAANSINGTVQNLTLGGVGNGTVGGTITTGTGTLTKDGAGTWTLTGANTYTGATTVSAGVLNIQNAAALGTVAGGVSVTSGAALQIQNNIAVGAEALTLNGTGIASDGALRNILGTNTYGGAVTLGSATRINSDAGTLTLSGAITGAGIALTVGGSGDTVLGGNIGTTTGTVTKDGAGTLSLGGVNTYTGGTTISAGTLKVTSPTGLGASSSAASLTAGAVLDLSGTLMTNTNALTLNGTGISSGGALINSSGVAGTYAGLITLGSDSSIMARNGNIAITNAGTITGAYGLTLGGALYGNIASVIGTSTLTKQDAGTWTLSAANTYTGLTTVSGGILTYAVNNAISTGAVTVNGAGAVLAMGAFSDSVGAVTLTAGDITGSGTLTSTSGFTMNNAGATSVSAILGGAVALDKSGAGTLTLSGANTYTGATTVSAGALQLDGSTASGSTVAIGTSGTLTGTGTVNGNATLTGGGIINKSSGAIAGTLGVTGGNWNGAGSVTGAATSSSGVFTIGSGANLTATGGLNVTGGTIAAGNSTSTITGSVNYTSNSSSSFQGKIAGSSTVTLNNAAATLTLGTALSPVTQAYTGATNVTAGTMVVNGTLQSGGVTVSGGTLKGNITAGGITSIQSGGTLSVGNSPGSGTFATLNLAGTTLTEFNTGALPTNPGTDFDTINVTAALSYGGELRLSFAGAIDNSATAFDLFAFGAVTPSNSFSSVTLYNTGGQVGGSLVNSSGIWSGIANLGYGTGMQSFSFNQSTGDLIVAVPEPSTWALLAFSLTTVMVLRRRRNS